MSDEDWRTVLDTNLNGFYNVLRRIVIAPAGSVVHLSTVANQAGNR